MIKRSEGLFFILIKVERGMSVLLFWLLALLLSSARQNVQSRRMIKLFTKREGWID